MTQSTNSPERKVTAEQIEKNCPNELQSLAERIKAHLEKAHKYKEKADQHYISVGQYLSRAREACDESGFEAFREKFCPDLGRTRAYELLALGQNKKSLEDIRASNRERVARHRAKKLDKACSDDRPVRYVTDKPDPVPQEALPGPVEAEAISITPEQVSQPVRPRNTVNPKDEALFDFSARVMELSRRTAKRKPEDFAATSVPTEKLAAVGNFLLQLVSLKKSPAKPTKGFVPQGNGLVSTEELAEAMRAAHAANDTTADVAEVAPCA